MPGNYTGGAGIVSIEDHERQRRMAPLRQVEAYWRALCSAGDIPARGQIDPRGMQDALEYAFLMERIAPGMAKLRVAGAHLSDLMGMEMAGMPLSSLILPESREAVSEGVAALFADPAIVRMQLKAQGGLGKPELQADLLLMPLRSDFGDVTRALGVLVSHGRIGRTPRRFVLEGMTLCPAVSPTATEAPGIVQADVQHRPEPQRQPGLAEDRAAFKPAARRGHLRLIVSND